MNLDRVCIIFCLFLLVLLWLPFNAFYFVILGLGFVCISAFLLKKWNCGIAFLFILLSFYQVQQFVKNAQNITAHQETTQIRIIKILHLKDYKTAIGKRQNSKKLYLKWQNKTPLVLERDYQVTLKIKPISGRLNQGNFNRQQWYFANHISAIATVKKAELILPQKNFSLRTYWFNKVNNQIKHLSAQDLILALAFGERAWLENLHWQVFKQTATAHLIAISGLHIGLVAWFGFWFIKILQYISCFFLEKISGQINFSFYKKYFLSHRLPLVFSLCSAIFYSFLADFSLSTLRALLAISFVFFIHLLRRHYTLVQYWWRVVAILLICDPFTILSSSFWLSILSVMSIIIWYQYFPLKQILGSFLFNEKWLKNSIIRFILGLLHLQIGILLLFTPIQLYFFEGMASTAFVANIIIVPFYSLIIIPCILFSLITNNIFHSWYWVDYLLQISLELLLPLSKNWVNLSQNEQWQIISINLFLLIILYLWINQKLKQYWKFAIISTSGFYGLFYLYFFSLPQNQWITFDVGQGLANAFVYRQGLQQKAILYDTGVTWGKGNQKNSMAKIEILPYLKRNGIDVEAIFISHDDRDHSGGVIDLLKVFPNAKLISSSAKKYANKQPRACIKGKKWQFRDFIFESYYPNAVGLKAKNANSCVILVKVNRYKILLTGDISQKEEYIFSPKIGEIDFLQVSHHGSKTSTSQYFLNYTKPKVAIISTGRWNMWHLPNKKVLERLKRNKITIFDTAKDGMININLDEKEQDITTTRNNWSAWYNFLN